MTKNTKIIKQLLNKKDGVYTTVDAEILFPKKFIAKGLASMSGSIRGFGVFAVVIDGEYSEFILPAKIGFEDPVGISEVTIEDRVYISLSYTKGMKLFSYQGLVVGDDMFTIFDQFIIGNNNIPFYLDTESVLDIFMLAVEYVGSGISKSPVEVGSMLALVSRAENGKPSRLEYSREDIVTGKKKVNYRGLGNVEALEDVFSLLAGNYQTKGITKGLALGDKAKVTAIEQHLRK